jgi:hypothetical protein
MKKSILLSLFVFLWCAALAFGQGAPGPSNYPTTTQAALGAPSGTCPGTNVLYLNTGNGNLYTCPVAGGPWVLAGGGSVAAYSFFGNTANPLTALVDPTTITDTAGEKIEFLSNVLVLTDNGGDLCALNGSNTQIACADAAGDSFVLGGGSVDWELENAAGSNIIESITGSGVNIKSSNGICVSDAGGCSLTPGVTKIAGSSTVDVGISSGDSVVVTGTTTVNDPTGTTFGTPTGGPQGAGTANMQGCFVNGVACNTSTSNVTSVFGRTGVVVAATNDYNFNQLAGTWSTTQVPTGGSATAFLNGAGTYTAPTGAVLSVSNSDGTLTCSPTTGAVTCSIALGHANTWTGVQTFNSPPVVGSVGGTAGSIQYLGTSSGSLTVGCIPTTTCGVWGAVGVTADFAGYLTGSNCNTTASTTSPAACGAAPTGVILTAASATTFTINTSTVTVNSRFWFSYDTHTTNCTTAPANVTSLIPPYVSAISTGTSFTITFPVAPLTTGVCVEYGFWN